MPPKKVIKKDKKEKLPLTKGKSNSSKGKAALTKGKPAKGKPALAKGKAGKKTKSLLTKGRLNKIGKLSLKEKVEMAT